MLIVLVTTACSGPPADEPAPPLAIRGAPPPDCHQVAVAWCDMQSSCGPIADECHTDWHLLCPGLQDAGAPEVSSACIAELERRCLIQGLPSCSEDDK